MATIATSTSEKTIQMKAFLGLHECDDGDTKIKFGEATTCDNWRVTRDGNLKKRDGQKVVVGVTHEYSAVTSTDVEYTSYDSTGSMTLKLYPTATSNRGKMTLSGTRVDVTAENWEDYEGYYMKPSNSEISWVYQLYQVAEENDGGYRWDFKIVRSEPTTELPVRGLWSGNVNGNLKMVACCDGYAYEIYGNGSYTVTTIGQITTTNDVHMFGFDNKLYFLNGTQYLVWDGTTFTDVAGYIPIVAHVIGPDETEDAGGVLLEEVNKLCGGRKCWLSPDGTNLTYTLPEKPTSLDYVKMIADGSSISAYTYSSSTGKITFTNSQTKGTNTIEIGYTMTGSDITAMRAQVTAMRFSELFSGSTDNRIFLYGDGSNKCFYSGIDYDGSPRADYFPDLNECAVGEANSEITSMIRHYSRLLCFKEDSAWSISASTTTLADSSTVLAFYAIPINKNLGNEAKGQVTLVMNSPRTLYHNEAFEWKSNNSYSGNLTADERQAYRISDRIYNTLRQFVLSECKCFDNNAAQEYYISYNGRALVHNYANDAWYRYTDFNAVCFCVLNDELYFGTSDGFVKQLSATMYHDDGYAVEAYWESGSLDFGQDYTRKYSSTIWVPVKQTSNTNVEITIETDRKSDYKEKTIVKGTSGFSSLDFSTFSFYTSGYMQKINKLKIKAKKFVYYKLIFKSDELNTTATILGGDVKVRQTGYAK